MVGEAGEGAQQVGGLADLLVQIASLVAAEGAKGGDEAVLAHLAVLHAGRLTFLRRGVEDLLAALVAGDEASARQLLQCVVHGVAVRSEERRVGKACVRQCISRWSPYH